MFASKFNFPLRQLSQCRVTPTAPRRRKAAPKKHATATRQHDDNRMDIDASCAPVASWASPGERSNPVSLEHNGVIQKYPAMDQNKTDLPAAAGAILTRKLVDSSEIVQQRTSPHVWQGIAHRVRRTGVLRLAMVGFSTLNGCGSRDPSPFCDVEFCWSRRMLDALSGHLHRVPQFTELRVFGSSSAKSAAHPSYFGYCTSSFVQHKADVVLFEAGTNMYDGKSHLEMLIPSFRKAAPHAALVLIFWAGVSKSSSEHEPTVSKHIPKYQRMVRDAADQFSVDAVFVNEALRHLAINSTACGTPKYEGRTWSARNGKDHHPNGHGHQLMGELVAHHLHRSLLVASSAARKHAAPDQDTSRPGRPSDISGGAILHETNLTVTDVCINSADALPVVNSTGNWTLVDEGGSGKGVKKLGWVSRSIGDTLDLAVAPPEEPAIACLPRDSSNACGSTTRCALARLGYLLSSQPGQGWISVSCHGACTCKCMQCTNLRSSKVAGDCRNNLACPPDRNISVTSLVEIAIAHRSQHEQQAQCVLRATNIPSAAAAGDASKAGHKGAMRGFPSKVRIDSLSWRGMRCEKAFAVG
jgi:hypothetical protein